MYPLPPYLPLSYDLYLVVEYFDYAYFGKFSIVEYSHSRCTIQKLFTLKFCNTMQPTGKQAQVS